jgi:hypothetical protein
VQGEEQGDHAQRAGNRTRRKILGKHRNSDSAEDALQPERDHWRRSGPHRAASLEAASVKAANREAASFDEDGAHSCVGLVAQKE